MHVHAVTGETDTALNAYGECLSVYSEHSIDCDQRAMSIAGLMREATQLYLTVARETTDVNVVATLRGLAARMRQRCLDQVADPKGKLTIRIGGIDVAA